VGEKQLTRRRKIGEKGWNGNARRLGIAVAALPVKTGT